MNYILLNDIQKVSISNAQKSLFNEFLAIKVFQTVLPIESRPVVTKSQLVNMMSHVKHSFRQNKLYCIHYWPVAELFGCIHVMRSGSYQVLYRFRMCLSSCIPFAIGCLLLLLSIFVNQTCLRVSKDVPEVSKEITCIRVLFALGESDLDQVVLNVDQMHFEYVLNIKG